MLRDLASNLGAVPALAPAVHSATATGAVIDLKGSNGAVVFLNTGAIVGAGDFTAKVQESDTTTSGDFTDAAAGALIGSLPATLLADKALKIGYRGHKRYVRVVLTKNSGTSIAASALVALDPLLKPAA